VSKETWCSGCSRCCSGFCTGGEPVTLAASMVALPVCTHGHGSNSYTAYLIFSEL